MKPVLRPYSNASASAKALQKWLQENGFPKLKRTQHPKPNRFVINWGSSQPVSSMCLNFPEDVADASNKLKSFDCMWGYVNIPDYTTDKEVAQEWIDKGHMVVGRKLLNSHSGKGIVLFDSETITSNLECPLYVQYKKKRKEFRVHVFNGKVIDVQQKKRRLGGGVSSNYIRNHSNGWVFCRDNVTLPEDAAEQAIKAVDALCLTFGAVDIIWNEKENKSYVLEVNTAPGLEGTTLEKYGKAIKEILVNV